MIADGDSATVFDGIDVNVVAGVVVYGAAAVVADCFVAVGGDGGGDDGGEEGFEDGRRGG